MLEVLAFAEKAGASTLDLTGGAPELNQNFRWLVSEARSRGFDVIDRCNLTVLLLPEEQGLAEFLARQGVRVVASMPCYSQDNVDLQRGSGVFNDSIKALQLLNTLGYGDADSGLIIDLVYNPVGPVLPPPQAELEEQYRAELFSGFGIRFNSLLVLTNMPIHRFGHALARDGKLADYEATLRAAYLERNLESVMCRSLVSIDWRGYLYDCDFNQMLKLSRSDTPMHVSEFTNSAAVEAVASASIAVAPHCFGCTAGQGSSCGGALDA